MIRELVFAVTGEQTLRLGLVVRRELAQHRLERAADGCTPFVVSGRVAAKADERVARGTEDEFDGIDERAVEIKKKGGLHD